MCVCVCVFILTSPPHPAPACDDGFAKTTSRERWEGPVGSETRWHTHAHKHRSANACRHTCTGRYGRTGMHARTHKRTHTHVHIKHTVAWSKPSLWGIQIWLAVSEFDLSCLCEDMIAHACAALVSLKNVYSIQSAWSPSLKSVLLLRQRRPPRLTVTPTPGEGSGHSSK